MSMIFCSRLATGDHTAVYPKRNAGVYLESKTDVKKRAWLGAAEYSRERERACFTQLDLSL